MRNANRVALAHATIALSLLAFGLTACTTPARVQLAARPDAARTFSHWAVACDHPLASEAGAAMLRQGGNAVDAAVAAALTLSVVRPESCGIGGGGFMLIHAPATEGAAEQSVALNFRECAPAAVDADYFDRIAPSDASTLGVHAVAVPGAVAGLLGALDRYGTLERSVVFAPAIRIAREGFRADEHLVECTRVLARKRAEHPDRAALSAYLWKHHALEGRVAPGDLIRDPEQALALQLISDHGADAFYSGEIARAIDDLMRREGGPVTLDDLARYTVRTQEPLRGALGDRTILSQPPPSSGGIALLQVLGVLDRLGIRPGSVADHASEERELHTVVEAMRHAFADRARWLADDAFVDVPTGMLLSDAWLDSVALRIHPDRRASPEECGRAALPPEDGGTSHFSVIDANGMAVSCTMTVNLEFGSMACVPGFGFVLNNEMDDFTTTDAPNSFGLQQSDRNRPEPGKRPLSSMTPTIVLRDGRVELVGGASGGPRIITATLQVILHALVHDQTLREAVTQPRIHHQWMPDLLRYEGPMEGDRRLAAMRALGHEIAAAEGDLGHVQFIRVRGDRIEAEADPRKGGRAAGE